MNWRIISGSAHQIKKTCFHNSKTSINAFGVCQRYLHTSVKAKDTFLENAATNEIPVRWEDAKPFSEIPGDKVYPIVGNMWPLLPVIGNHSLIQFHKYCMEKSKQYGKIVKIGRGIDSRSFVILFDPKDFQTVFHHEGKYPVRTGFSPWKKLNEHSSRNDGLFTKNYEKWYKFRSGIQKHMMRPKSVESYIPAMDVVADNMIRHIKALRDNNGEIPNFLNELYKWALDSVALVVMDTKLESLQHNLHPESPQQRLMNAIADFLTSLFSLNFSLPIWRYFPTPTLKKFEKSLAVITEIALRYLNEAIERIERKTDDKENMTILETLLSNEGFNYQDAVTMTVDVFLAGMDTTSHAVAFMLYHLAKNEKEQEKAYLEIKNIVKSKDSPISVSDLRSLQYLKACFKESMRLNPVLSGTSRVLNHDIVLSGYQVPAGVACFMYNLTACRLEENFKDADKFKPERWLKVNNNHYDPFLLLPFGFGPRMCIGKRIAEQEIFLLLTKILRNFKVEYHHENIDCYTRMVNIPDKPLRLQFIDRH